MSRVWSSGRLPRMQLFKPTEPDPDLRLRLDLPPDRRVIVYNGNCHPANVDEIRSLYLAVGALSRRGVSLRLVRLGADYVPVLPRELVDLEELIIKVPFQPREAVPRFLALADLFVQPGRPDAFNDYRFPSKLPEFLAMGKPTILPAANIGRFMKPDREGILLRRGDAIEIAHSIERVLSNAELAGALGRNARAFYERELSWTKSATTVMSLYSTVLMGGRNQRTGA